MRLEELENDRDRQKEKSEVLHEASLKHRQQVEQLGMLREQLLRISESLTSDDLARAHGETQSAEELISQERGRLDMQRRELLRENLALTHQVETGLEKTRKALGSNWVTSGVGTEALRIGLGVVVGFGQVVFPSIKAPEIKDESPLERTLEAAKRHATRLEESKKQLLQTRQLLDDMGGS